MDILKGVVNTLNEIDVKGEDNLDKLLGCIRALKTVITAMEAERKDSEKNG